MKSFAILLVLLAIVAGFFLLKSDSTRFTGQASGALGEVLVYGQTPEGPLRLSSLVHYRLSRPQDLAFQLSANGTGLRNVRIEQKTPSGKVVLHEEELTGPVFMAGLDYVLHLDERSPDEVVIWVILQAPHTEKSVTRYGFTLGRPDPALGP